MNIFKNKICMIFSDQEGFLSEPADESRKTYWYHKDWRDYIVDYRQFYIKAGHHNPESIPLFSETHIAENVKIGWAHLGLYFYRVHIST